MNTRVYAEYMKMFPRHHTDTVGWEPEDEHSIIVELNDGETYIYDSLKHTLTKYRRPSKNRYGHTSEEVWRKEFARRLNRAMNNCGCSQKDLADRTGISEVTISRYLRGAATPSSYNLVKITKALRCNPQNLIRF